MNLYTQQILVAVAVAALLAGCSTSTNVQEQPTQTSSDPVQSETAQDTADSMQMDSAQNSVETDSIEPNSIEPTQDATESERLGTQWGDDVDSKATMVDIQRIDDEPIDEMQVIYADKNYNGRAINSISLAAGRVDFSVAADRGQLSIYRDRGDYFIQGKAGQAYRLVYQNNSANTYEIVATVDGLNVLNGDAASRYDSGYVLEPNDELVIEGFRKSQSTVASFIFSQPKNAYAANTSSGSIDNTGIIGTVVYEIYNPNEPKSQASRAQAFPADDGYAKAPQ